MTQLQDGGAGRVVLSGAFSVPAESGGGPAVRPPPGLGLPAGNRAADRPLHPAAASGLRSPSATRSPDRRAGGERRVRRPAAALRQPSLHAASWPPAARQRGDSPGRGAAEAGQSGPGSPEPPELPLGLRRRLPRRAAGALPPGTVACGPARRAAAAAPTPAAGRGAGTGETPPGGRVTLRRWSLGVLEAALSHHFINRLSTE